MSRRKRVLLWTGLLVVLAGAWVAVLEGIRRYSMPPPGISLENFNCLELGMTEQECDAILCGPMCEKKDMGFCGPPKICTYSCKGTNLWVRAIFESDEDEDGRMQSARLFNGHTSQSAIAVCSRNVRPFFGRLRRWLGL